MLAQLSVVTQLAPALMAGLPASSAWVCVGPPFSANGPSIGFVLILSVGWLRKPLPLSFVKLLPSEVTRPPSNSKLIPILLATTVLRRYEVVYIVRIPLAVGVVLALCVLLVMVQLVTSNGPPFTPPPPKPLWLPLTVELLNRNLLPRKSIPPPNSVASLPLKMQPVKSPCPVELTPPTKKATPPPLNALFPVMTQSVSVSALRLKMPPPLSVLVNPLVMVNPLIPTFIASVAKPSKMVKMRYSPPVLRRTVSSFAPGPVMVRLRLMLGKAPVKLIVCGPAGRLNTIAFPAELPLTQSVEPD